MDSLHTLLPVICIVAAAFIAISGNSGWGWFLFVAVLLS